MPKSPRTTLAQAEKAVNQAARLVKEATEAVRASKPPSTPVPHKEGTLGALIAAKLRRRRGVTLEEVQNLLRSDDPQPHSARAAISINARRAGLSLQRDGQRYRATA
jgi:hypothetical protein